MKQQLSSISLFVDMEGQAWGGFTAERGTRETYFPPGEGRYSECHTPNVWPGLKEAIRHACLHWGDVQPDSVRPFYVQLRWNLRMGEWTRHVVKHLDESDLERLGVRA